MKLKDLIGKVGNMDAFIKNEGSNKTWYHDYVEVRVHLVKEIDGVIFEKDVWESDGSNIGNPGTCRGVHVFNQECENSSSPNLEVYFNHEVINFDFECILEDKIAQTSYGNTFRKKVCTFIINIR
jgi:hypothetical protein